MPPRRNPNTLREAKKGEIAKCFDKIKTILANDQYTARRKFLETERRFSDICKWIDDVKVLDEEILAALDENQVTDAIELVNTFHDDTSDMKYEVAFQLEELKLLINPPPPPPDPPIADPTNRPQSRLPKLELPEFDGNILFWRPFWDVFETEVHLNAQLNNAMKFNFLNPQLRGEAKATIAGLTPTNDNYPKAIDLLKERYGQPNKIIAAYMRALYYLSAPSEDHASLRSFYDQLESHIRGLEALGKQPDGYGDLLVVILLEKMSAETRRSLARHHGGTEWTLAELRDAIKMEIDVLSVSQQTNMLPASNTATVLYAGSSSTQRGAIPKKQKKCAFCDEAHNSFKCNKYPDPVKRREVTKEKKLCFNCLSSNAHPFGIQNCNSPNRCRICKQTHHTSLHIPESKGETKPSSNTTVAVISIPSVTTVAAINGSSNSDSSFSFLETALAVIGSAHHRVNARILMDKAAQKSFITSNKVKQLKLSPSSREFLVLSGLATAPSGAGYFDVVSVTIFDRRGIGVVIKAVVLDAIVNPLDDPHRKALTQMPHLKNIPLAHPTDTGSNPFEIDLLIGGNFYWNFVGDHVIRGPGPTAVESRLGYLLSGPLDGQNETLLTTSTILHVQAIEQFDLSRFWTLESLGIHPEIETAELVKHYQSTCIEFDGNRYKARLPWKPNLPELHSNFHLCQKRQRSVVLQLYKKPNALQQVELIIQDQLKRGFIEKVSEPKPRLNGCHYVPLFTVKKDSLTTPIRVVFDYSCSGSNGISLNHCVEIGPPLLNDMFCILLRFRIHEIGLTADIEKAFHQITLHEDDRDFTRFLWIRDVNDPNSEFDIYRFNVVPFGISCSPFILNSVVQKHLFEQTMSPIARDMQVNVYADNVISGVDSQAKAIDYYKKSTEIFNAAGLPLTAWGSNNASVQQQAKLDGLSDESPLVKVLGLRWNRDADTLELPPVHLSNFYQSTPTKRNILRGISSVYDPLGFVSPLSIGAKIIIQDLWKAKVDWDDQPPVNLVERWTGIAQALEAVDSKLPRSCLSSSNQINHLYIFVDASKRAYGAVAYFGNSSCTAFAVSKSRVAPLQLMSSDATLPQLELLAAYVGIRLAMSIIKALEPSGIKPKITFFSDSQITLHWISKKTGHPNQFVLNRATKIQQFTESNQATWRYVKTEDNPADLLTRGITLEQFRSSVIWRNGPSWLLKPEDWPKWDVTRCSARVLHLATSSEKNQAANETPIDISDVMDVSRYNWTQLIRVTARVRRFINNLKTDASERLSGSITASELALAEEEWIRSFQRKHLTNEYIYLKSKKGKRPPAVAHLDLFLDTSGIIRCHGRLRNANISPDMIHPIMIPKKTLLANLIIQHAHQFMFHYGPDATVCKIRQRFWIPSLKQQVRSTLRRCTKCKRVTGKPYQEPDHAALPDFRVNVSYPFAVTGVDFTGSFAVKGHPDVFICLFTCASSRAVHLEVVEDLTTETFIEAFRRFTSHHSLPKIVMSDNATTFGSASTAIAKICKDGAVTDYLANRQVEWRFITKRAPWHGGYWERLVGLAKEAIKKMMGNTRFPLKTFRTIVAEIEARLNDRPLTVVSSDLDGQETLTPSHLMIGRRLTTLPYDFNVEDEVLDPTYEENSSDLSKRVRRLQHALNTFISVFKSKYLTSLRERHERTRGKYEETIKIGEVVHVHDDRPRSDWKIAVVEKLIRGQDNKVRSAEIRTARGVTNRPISKLYPLEVSVEPSVAGNVPEEPETASDSSSQPLSQPPAIVPAVMSPVQPTVVSPVQPAVVSPVQPTSRPTRRAAVQAKDRMLGIALQEKGDN